VQTLTEACSATIAFAYRSIDRLILNAYIPTLQTPGAMAIFLRQVCKKPILSGLVFKWLTDRFVAQVRTFAQARNVPLVYVKGREKPGAVGQRLLRNAAHKDRWGVIAIVVHQESARVFGSVHAGGRPTNFRVQEDRRLINHYYFYLRDRDFGDGFVRMSSYPPFQMRIWWNAHGYLAAQLRCHRIAFHTADNCIIEVADPAALQRFADQVTPQLVERLALRWLSQIPDPLTREERAAGYPLRFSIFQAEFSNNVIFKQTQVLNRVYEALLRDHLHLGRPDMLKVIFDRRIYRNTPSVYVTRILRQGVVTCLKVFYKHSWLKQYNKGGRVLRTEICINNPMDFMIKKSLVHLGYLGRVAYHAITRFEKAQAVALATALERSTLERLVTPSTHGGQRVPGIRVGAPRAMRILAALGCAGLSFKAFSNAEFRTVLIEQFGADPQDITPGHIGYELRKLRGKGLIRKVGGRNRYTVTDLGYRAAIFLTKLHDRLLGPGLTSLDTFVREAFAASPHEMDQALARLDADFTTLAQLCGLEVAA
jgi:hypothetical protein